MRACILFLFFCIFFSACSSNKPKTVFSIAPTNLSPDYSLAGNWAALPNLTDNADRVPGTQLKDQQQNAKVDVFFLHPTTYTGQKGQDQWNGSTSDPSLNTRTDETTILFQASVFNGAGSIYAPRYRQAHLHAYYTEDKTSAKAAFELAYSDVKKAFEYYLAHYNNGRPIIIASHSQGTNHATALLKEFFDGKRLQDQLVAAYLVGMPIRKEEFQNIPLCTSPEQINCFCTWRTYKSGYFPKKVPFDKSIGVTNPLTWTSEEHYADFSQNQGGVLRNFEKNPKPGLTDAKVEQGLLWAAKPRFFGKIFITFKNYHIADYNFYYVNVRENAKTRVQTFLKNWNN